jgi:RNA-binding protein 15
MRDEEGKNQLRITQRLRLDQSKLDDVMKRINSSQAHGIFLAMPASVSSPQSAENGGSAIQSRPLRNLVSYLKQKEAAGVISLAGKEASGVLYAFPPCQFSTELLVKGVPSLEVDLKDDHLVVAVIRGGVST